MDDGTSRVGDRTASLSELVLDRLAAAGALDESVKDRVLEALDLDPAGSATGESVPVLYLREIRVRGFRGIGAEARLELPDGPGLTLVVGRNGSGKSSFAEAAELALTGVNRRWQENPRTSDSWRNLHAGDEPRIAIELRADDDDQPITVCREWQPDDELAAGEWTLRRSAASERLDRSPFARELELYRPFLPHSELGSLIDSKPSEMYDALHSLLGIDALDRARSALRDERLTLERAAREANADRRALRTDLAAVDDERAAAALGLLRPRVPDLDAIADLVAGGDVESDVLSRLRAQADLTVPSPDQVSAARDRLSSAVRIERERSVGATGSAASVAELLERAQEYYAASGPGPCPVCAEGGLDDAWAGRTQAMLTELRARMGDVRAARNEVAAARRAAQDLIAPAPPVLRDALDDPLVAATAREWDRWSALRAAEPAALLAEQVERHDALVRQVNELVARSAAELARLGEAWRPLAERLAAWSVRQRAVMAAAAELDRIKRAEEWLKEQAEWFRDQRLGPLADSAQRVWNRLRQQSNVELGTISLAGSANRRRVELPVTVDDAAAGALGVMSQGELNGLGLALFLPRAMSPESPFRFVVIDDPVQAMDMSRVDGLADVLAAMARTRQVVVFTHDGRLAEAVRRLRIAATILQVERKERSAVDVVRVADAATRYLADARALAANREMPPDIVSEIVVSSCRSALEAASTARARRVLLDDGRPHADVDRLLDEARTTLAKVALAVFGAPGRNGELLGRLNRDPGPWAATALNACRKGAHQALGGNPHSLIGNVEDLVEWLS